jgi:hypothetical protein
MIPTTFLFGMVIGRIWAIPMAGIVWTLLIAFSDSCDGSCLPSSIALGLANAAVGVAVHKGVAYVISRASRRGQDRCPRGVAKP